VVLVFEKTAAFQPGGRRPGVLELLAHKLKGNHGALAYLVLAGLALVVPNLVTPVLSRVFVDYYLVGGMKTWVQPLLVVTHRLKGAASLHGFPAVAHLASELETLLEPAAFDATRLSTLLTELKRALAAAQKAEISISKGGCRGSAKNILDVLSHDKLVFSVEAIRQLERLLTDASA